MSPLQIIMLLTYFCHGRDYRDEAEQQHANSQAVKDALQNFLHWELLIKLLPDDVWLIQNRETRLSQYAISDRGRAMVEAYKAIKLPVMQWVQP